MDNQFGATCLECGILRVHIVNLERDLSAEHALVREVMAERDAARAEAARLRNMLTVEVLIEAFKQTANGRYVLVEGSDVALDGWWNFDQVRAALEADHDR